MTPFSSRYLSVTGPTLFCVDGQKGLWHRFHPGISQSLDLPCFVWMVRRDYDTVFIQVSLSHWTYLVLCGWSEGTMTPFSSRYLSVTGPTLFCVDGQKGLWHRFHPGISQSLDLPCFVWMVRRDYDTVFIQVSLSHWTYLVLCGWSEGTMTPFSSRYLSVTGPTLFCVDDQKGLWHHFHPGISQSLDLPCFVWMVRRDYDTVFIQVSLSHWTYLVLCGWSEGTMTPFSSRYLSVTGPTLFCVDGQKGLWHRFHPGISQSLDLPCFVWMVRRDYDTVFIQVSLSHWTYLVLCGWSEGTMTPFSSRYLSVTGPTLFCVDGQKGLWHRFHPGISQSLDLPCFVWMVRRDYDTVFIQVSLSHWTYLVLCGWSEGTMTPLSSRYLSGWNFHGSFQYRSSRFKFQTLHQTCERKPEEWIISSNHHLLWKTTVDLSWSTTLHWMDRNTWPNNGSLSWLTWFGGIFGESCIKIKEIGPRRGGSLQ